MKYNNILYTLRSTAIYAPRNKRIPEAAAGRNGIAAQIVSA